MPAMPDGRAILRTDCPSRDSAPAGSHRRSSVRPLLSATDHATDPMVSSAPMTGSIWEAWT